MNVVPLLEFAHNIHGQILKAILLTVSNAEQRFYNKDPRTGC
jgi:hypothetical protein